MSLDKCREEPTRIRTSLVSVDGEYVFDRHLTPEQNLWAAVIHRAMLDSQGIPATTEADWRNWRQRSARRWFRNRWQRGTGSWRWVAESLELPSWMARRIVREALREENVGRRSSGR